VSRLDLIVGPNGAGKSTFVRLVLAHALPPGTRFVNADEIAKIRWPGAAEEHAYDAAAIAADTRDRLIRTHQPFMAETVFSHPSKLDLIDQALGAGYTVKVHVIAVPLPVCLARVPRRVASGGHSVPREKIAERYERLWPLVAEAIVRADGADVWDNSRRSPVKVAEFIGGLAVAPPAWPAWTPEALSALT
jgi:predicted ABC-type ATPase